MLIFILLINLINGEERNNQELNNYLISLPNLFIYNTKYSNIKNIINDIKNIYLLGNLEIDKGFNFNGNFIMNETNSFLKINSISKFNNFTYINGKINFNKKKFMVTELNLYNKFINFFNNIETYPFNYYDLYKDKSLQIFELIKNLNIYYNNNTLIKKKCNLKNLKNKSINKCNYKRNNEEDDSYEVVISCPTEEDDNYNEKIDLCPEDFNYIY